MATNDKHEDFNTSGDYSRPLHPDSSHDHVLKQVRTAGSISIPPDLFEKLYLSPENRVKGDLRKTFGNPTPIGLGGFLLALSPLSCDLMAWAPMTQAYKGASDIPAYFFFGGMCLTIAGVMEWILGNTYISVVFVTFGAFWATFGGILQPFYATYATYAANPTTDPSQGLMTVGFNNSIAYFPLWMGVLCLVYLICSLRTNVVLVGILAPLPPAFSCIAAAFFYTAQGDMAFPVTLLKTAGALVFITCMLGWYLFSALMLAGIDFPIQLPVGDLSTRIKGYSEKAAAKAQVDGDYEARE